MKNRNLLHLEGHLPTGAVRVLRRFPGVAVTAGSPGSPPAASLGHAVVNAGGARVGVAVEYTLRCDASVARRLTARALSRHPGEPLLVVAGESTSEARRTLAERGVALFDGRGYARVELPGLVYFSDCRTGDPTQVAGSRPPTRLTGQAGLAAQVLLRDPGLCWQVQGLAEQAQVSTGIAHRVLDRLCRAGIMAANGGGPHQLRRVTDPAGLLELWTEEQSHASVTRTPVFLHAKSLPRVVDQLSGRLAGAGLGYALTSGAGATLAASFVSLIPTVGVWLPAATGPGEVHNACDGFETVSYGANIILMQTRDDTPLAFRYRVQGRWVADPIRLYADLRDDPDPAGWEEAELLRQELIGF